MSPPDLSLFRVSDLRLCSHPNGCFPCQEPSTFSLEHQAQGFPPSVCCCLAQPDFGSALWTWVSGQQDSLVLLAGGRAMDFSQCASCCPCSEGRQREHSEAEADNSLAMGHLAWQSVFDQHRPVSKRSMGHKLL